MKTKNNLLDKYYKGETSLKEERTLKNEILNSDKKVSEKDVFGFYNSESCTPENIEEEIFRAVQMRQNKKKSVRRRMYSLAASAAIILLLVGFYFNLQTQKNKKLENEFFVMEQALFQVSESIQPPNQEEMLVLWVDDNVEIIIN